MGSRKQRRSSSSKAASTTADVARARLSARLVNVFQEIGVPTSLTDGRRWDVLHSRQNVQLFELAHGVEGQRFAYNERCFARARRTRQSVLGSHAGCHDLFVPIPPAGEELLVIGPFALRRPTSGELSETWRWLTGTQARASDPEFAHYLAVTLDLATFEGPMIDALRRFAEVYAGLLGNRGELEAIAAEAGAVRAKLSMVRFRERSFNAALEMIDPGTSEVWSSRHWADNRRYLGADRRPSHAIVGLTSGKADDPDAIDQILRCDAYQRASLQLAHELGGVVCGNVGDWGVMFLVEHSGKGVRVQNQLLEIAQRARTLGRRFALSVHLGISDPSRSAGLPTAYEAALAAAEYALTNDQAVVTAASAPARVLSPLGDLRRELARSVVLAPRALGARFDRYLDAVTARSGYRLEPARAHIEAGFEQIVDVLRVAGALDDRSVVDLREWALRGARAETLSELLVAYRSAARDVSEAVQSPKLGEHARSLRRATAFIREHCAERLTLARVARVAGFAPTYFSKIFAAAEKTTLPRYIRRVRVERAQRLLESTGLGVDRVGQLAGFRTRSSFYTAFTDIVGVTPAEHRSGGPRGSKK